MPAASPTINITPSSLRRQPIAISSSPSLISPSAFVQPKQAGLKSGSRAQQVPDGAATGFASAGSLWKLHRVDSAADAVENAQAPPRLTAEKTKKRTAVKEQSNDDRAKDKAEGKLIRPRKKRKISDVPAAETAEPKGDAATASTYFGLARQELLRAEARPISRSASVDFDISGYTFEAPGSAEPLAALLEPMKPLSKPRKRSGKSSGPKERTTAPATKAAGKKKHKSAFFVLNSDDPSLNDTNEPGMPDKDNQTSAFEDQHTTEEHSSTRPLQLAADGQRLPGRDAGDSEVEPDAQLVEVTETNDRVMEKSSYFSNAIGGATNDTCSVPDHEAMLVSPCVEPTPALATPRIPNDTALRRRLSWTPAKVQLDVGVSNPTAEDSPTSGSPKRQLSDILGGFGYVSNVNDLTHVAPGPMGPQVATKRRKIELSDIPANTTAVLERLTVTKVVKVKPTKKTKQPKKVQTITALATAAFQPPKQASPTDDTEVTQFFATTKSKAADVAQDSTELEPKLAKPKKLRKSRAKSATNGSGAPTEKAAAKASKSKKATKVKFNEADHRTKLYSPGQASAQFVNQDFLFGTSSQLAVDESPTFIRDMQAAMHESETVEEASDSRAPSDMLNGTQVTSPGRWKSRVRVPSAPHGTNLSVGQADKDLWCETSRDFKGGLFRSYGAKPKKPRTETAKQSSRVTTEDARVPEDHTNSHPAVSAIVPAAVRTDAGAADVQAETGGDVVSQHILVPPIATNADRDIGTTLQRDKSTVGPANQHSETSSTRHPEIAVDAHHQRPPTPPPQPLSPSRSPLRPLDRNVQLLSTFSPHKAVSLSGIRHMSTKPHKGGKDVQSSAARLRGRPPKAKSDAALKSAPKARKSADKKSVHVAGNTATKPPKYGLSASQPEWLDIDEIYDSETPATPSPPRRRARSSPPAVTSLQLSPSCSPPPGIVAPEAVVPSVKVNDGTWLNTKDGVFAQITKIVRGSPRSTDPEHPSWWQKVLLYDPIVLENLTEWLNEQGLRVERDKVKAKPKKKGRKRMDEPQAVDDVVEWEVVQGPLQAWMVQKWCEEKSVCCLWKGGMRGGVRTNY